MSKRIKKQNRSESEKAKRLIKKVENDVGVSSCRLLFAIDSLQTEIIEMTTGETISEKAFDIAECLDLCLSVSSLLARASEKLKRVTTLCDGEVVAQ